MILNHSNLSQAIVDDISPIFLKVFMDSLLCFKSYPI